jgi:signal transduction histidine kinase
MRLGHLRPPRESVLRVLPFASVALLGQLSALWPPGPSNQGAYAVSTVLLLVLLLAAFTLGARRGFTKPGAWIVRASVYAVSVAFLMVATGGVDSGLGALLLIPVVGVALYGTPRESVAIAVGVLVALVVVSVVGPPHIHSSTPRRIVVMESIVVVISVAVHVLRRQLTESNLRTVQLLHHEEAINTAARQLVQLSEPPQITALGARLAAQIAVPSEAPDRSAAYFRIDDGMLVVDVPGTSKGIGGSVVECWPVEEHPGLRDAVATLRPVSAPLDPAEAGPALGLVLRETGITHGAWVPVCPDGDLHGVLSVSTRNGPLAPECVDRCVALGHFLELALSNWAAHEKLEQQATAEERRRIARELHDGLAHELAFIASKTRGCATGTAPSAGVDVRAVAGAADRALDEARRAITILSIARPQTLDDAIAQTAEDLGARHGMAVDLDLAEGVEVPGDVTENLLRIVREAMTNAASHGGSEHVKVTLEQHDGLRLVIEDDGCGFETADDRSPDGSGFGLQGMRERASSVGAVLQVVSAPRQGTRVEVAFR